MGRRGRGNTSSARLNLAYTVLSKRFLTRLVQEGHVAGWDDPRMPTLAGLRRRGVPPAAIREFVRRIGVARANSLVDVAIFESAVRDTLNRTAARRMAVLRPLKVVIENYPASRTEELDAINHPDDPGAGTRRVRFGREVYIEREDFVLDPPRNFHRLAPGREVRLRYAYFVTCRAVVKDAAGEVVELRCTYDPATRGGNAPDGRKVRGTIHWVSAAHSLPAEVRLYHPLFTRPDPGADGDMMADLNPHSLEVLKGAMVEPGLAGSNSEEPVQFERQGYFCPRPRLRAGPARLQPRDRPARQLGQDAGGRALGSAAYATSRHPPPWFRSSKVRPWPHGSAVTPRTCSSRWSGTTRTATSFPSSVPSGASTCCKRLSTASGASMIWAGPASVTLAFPESCW